MCSKVFGNMLSRRSYINNVAWSLIILEMSKNWNCLREW